MLDKMIRIAVTGALALTVMAVGSSAAIAKDGDVIRTGQCSGSSDWKLKLSPENGKIELEFEVDSNKSGQDWRVKLFHDGNRFFTGTRTTGGASGSFTVRQVVANHSGTDSFKAKAVNLASGETCVGTASI
jgi:hypothetical protein